MARTQNSALQETHFDEFTVPSLEVFIDGEGERERERKVASSSWSHQAYSSLRVKKKCVTEKAISFWFRSVISEMYKTFLTGITLH